MARLRTTLCLMAAGALACGGALVLGGCNILGPAGYFLMGPEKVDAQYELDPDQPVVVFIDDSGSLVPDRTSRRRIGQAVEKSLLEEADVKRVISSDSALAVVSREKFGQPLGVAEVGQAVGADIVVYCLINGFTLSPDGVTYQPAASALVRIVDVKTKERIWPTGDETARQVTAQRHEQQGPTPSNLGQRAEAERRLASQLGEEIGKLFFKHEAQTHSRVGGSSADDPG
jgi:hypothetical protein